MSRLSRPESQLPVHVQPLHSHIEQQPWQAGLIGFLRPFANAGIVTFTRRFLTSGAQIT
jgi:hypothetical protein